MAKRYLGKKLTSKYTPFYIKKFSGMNSKIDENEIDTEHGVLAQNCRFENKPGAIVKRPAIAYYNSTRLGTSPIDSLYRFYKSDGTTNKLYAIYSTNIKIGTDSSGTFTSLSTPATITAGARWSFVTYKDLIFYHLVFYDQYWY